MLPQPNFGKNSTPNEEEPEGPPKKVGRLRIALWVQTVFAVLAGNFLIINVFAARNLTVEDIRESNTDTDLTAAEALTHAQDTFEAYQSTGFLVSNLVVAGLTILAAIVTALCAVRLKSRLRTVRRVALLSSTILLLVSMFTVLAIPPLFIVLMLWVFASILALWWLFSSDVKYWLSE